MLTMLCSEVKKVIKFDIGIIYLKIRVKGATKKQNKKGQNVNGKGLKSKNY